MEINIKLDYAFNKYHIESNITLNNLEVKDMLRSILDLTIGRNRYINLKEESDNLYTLDLLKYGTTTPMAIILVVGDLEDNIKNLNALLKLTIEYLDIDKTINIYIDKE